MSLKYCSIDQLVAYIIIDVDEQAQSKVQPQQWEAIWDEAYQG